MLRASRELRILILKICLEKMSVYTRLWFMTSRLQWLILSGWTGAQQPDSAVLGQQQDKLRLCFQSFHFLSCTVLYPRSSSCLNVLSWQQKSLLTHGLTAQPPIAVFIYASLRRERSPSSFPKHLFFCRHNFCTFLISATLKASLCQFFLVLVLTNHSTSLT